MKPIIRNKEKKRWRAGLFFILHFSFFIFLSCNSDDDGTTDNTPVAVQFGSGNIAVLKTTETGDQWTPGDKIGIFMIAKDAASISGNIKESADNIQYKADNGTAISSFSPVSGTPIYYPIGGDKVDFIAYYPYKTPLSNYTYPVDVSTQTTPGDIDVLYAKATNTGSGYDKNSSTVNLPFSHVLSKLSFTLISGAGLPDLTGAKIEISGVASTATMELKDGSLTATNSNQTITANTAPDGHTSSAIMVPQTLSGTKLIVTLADNVSKFEWTFTTAEWEAGKNYPYTITVDRTGIAVTTGNITDWTGTSTPPTEGGAGIWKVGDYYPDPKVEYSSPGVVQSGTAAIGIVFWVDPSDSRHGKIMELGEAILAWGYHGTETEAIDMDNGLANMATIKGLNPTFSDSPAFGWVDSKNGTAGATTYASNAKGIWYLPALNELKVLYNTYAIDKTAFINKLNAAGSVGFSVGYYDFYWSSTEESAFTAKLIYFDNGDNAVTSKTNSTAGRVRAIMAF